MERKTENTFEMKLDWSKAKITDVFGKERVVSTRDGILSLDIDDTPLYIGNVGE